MRNITLSFPEDVIERGRDYARRRGTSLSGTHTAERGRGTSCMTGKVFLDTNVLAYAGDEGSPEKRDIARDIIAETGAFAAAESAACSVVLSEDLNATQRYGVVEVRNPFV